MCAPAKRMTRAQLRCLHVCPFGRHETGFRAVAWQARQWVLPANGPVASWESVCAVRLHVQEFYELERSTLLASNVQLGREAAEEKARYHRMAESYEKARTAYAEAAQRCTAAEEELFKAKAEVGMDWQGHFF